MSDDSKVLCFFNRSFMVRKKNCVLCVTACVCVYVCAFTHGLGMDIRDGLWLVLILYFVQALHIWV